VYWELLKANLRQKQMNRIAAQLRPKLTITNGEHIPQWASLFSSKSLKHTKKIWFFNEYPSPDLMPLLANELWVWNERAAAAYRELHIRDELTIEVIGRPEVDFVFETPKKPFQNNLEARLRAKKICLFLAENTGNKVLDMEALSTEAIRWLCVAAQSLPSWTFVIKTRPLHTNTWFSEFEQIRNLANVILPENDLPLAECLRWPQVKVVAACTSSGLHVAAGVGIKAIRMKIFSGAVAAPIIDAISTPVHSISEFIAELERNSVPKKDPQSYPFLRQSLDRMEELCLKSLVAKPDISR